MCVYNGVIVSWSEFIRLKQIEREIKVINRAVQHGYQFKSWPIIISKGNDWELIESHWEFIPPSIRGIADLKAARDEFMWLNAKSENLFINDKGRQSMWSNAAVNGRCLVLSTGFFEYRHIPKIGKKGQPLKATEKIPYYITLKDNPGKLFLMAGVHQMWTNQERQQSADTFAIVTTKANELMAKVHNIKKRMPTILEQDLADVWLSDGLSKEEILEIGHHQFESEKLVAWPVAKNFYELEDPTKEFEYENLPPL